MIQTRPRPERPVRARILDRFPVKVAVVERDKDLSPHTHPQRLFNDQNIGARSERADDQRRLNLIHRLTNPRGQYVLMLGQYPALVVAGR